MAELPSPSITLEQVPTGRLAGVDPELLLSTDVDLLPVILNGEPPPRTECWRRGSFAAGLQLALLPACKATRANVQRRNGPALPFSSGGKEVW